MECDQLYGPARHGNNYFRSDLEQTSARKDPQLELLPGSAVGQRSRVEMPFAVEKPDQVVLDQGRSSDSGVELDRPESPAVRAQRHDSPGAIEDEAAFADRRGRPQQWGFQGPVAHRAQVTR